MSPTATAIGLRRRDWLALAAALFVLNLALSFQHLPPTPMVTVGHQVAPELALVLLALVLGARPLGPPPRALLAGLGVLLTLLALGRYAEVTAAGLLGRPLNLVWDLPHLPKVAPMLLAAMPAWAAGATLVGVLLAPVLVYGVLRWALGRVWRGLAQASARRVLGALAGAVLLLAIAGPLGVPTGGWLASPVSLAYAEQARLWLAASSGRQSGLAAGPEIRSDLGRLAGAHVVLVFLESYGAMVFDRPGLRERLAPAHSDLARAVAESGRAAVSALVDAPTYGGNSWFSHASLLAGVEVGDNDRYARLLSEGRETLVHRFAAQGYRALAVMPGLREDWPEGAFYGFAEILGARGLDYRGPDIGWWRIPDQFVAARLTELELASEDGSPRFVFFPTISTHAPFRPTPPYQPDWSRMLGEAPFDPEPLAAALQVHPNYSDLTDDYADAMVYAYTWLAGWLRELKGRDLVVMILGDHQPPASVGGREPSSLVPVHVITHRRDLLDALLKGGFQPGMTPERPALGPMHELHALLLRAFDSGPGPIAGEAGVDVPGARPTREGGQQPADLPRAEPSR